MQVACRSVLPTSLSLRVQSQNQGERDARPAFDPPAPSDRGRAAFGCREINATSWLLSVLSAGQGDRSLPSCPSMHTRRKKERRDGVGVAHRSSPRLFLLFDRFCPGLRREGENGAGISFLLATAFAVVSSRKAARSNEASVRPAASRELLRTSVESRVLAARFCLRAGPESALLSARPHPCQNCRLYPRSDGKWHREMPSPDSQAQS